MNDQLVAFGGDEHDDFEEAGSTVWTDDQPSVGVLAEVVDDHGVFDGVKDVVVSDPVATGRRVDLHMAILYYEIRRCQPPATKATTT